jgi:hypothetical protein
MGPGLLDEWQAVDHETEPIYELAGWRYNRHDEEDLCHTRRREPDNEVSPRSIVIASPSDVREIVGNPGSPASPLEPVLMYVTSPEAVRGEIARGEATPVAALGARAVLFSVLRASVHRRLHEGAVCLGCFRLWDGQDTAERLGLYRYDNDLYGTEPYGRVGLPRVPVHVDQLPDRLRDALMRTRFETISFDDSPRLQPVELVPCTTQSSYYVSLDGTTIRAVPGREDDYAEVYLMLAETITFRRVEPPPGA